MSSKLIVLTGAHKIVSAAISADSETFGRPHYYPDISASLKSRDLQNHWDSCPFFDELLMYREMDRDSEIVSLLKKTETIAFIEQWHIGNMAWAKARSSETGYEYEEKLHDLLKQFEGVEIKIWFISTDPEKIISVEFSKLYRAYLGELSTLLKRFELSVENLDGEAPPDLVSKRIMYLLDNGSS
jgi:hypothetical protein